MVKLAWAVPPAETVTVWDVPPLTLQFVGTAPSCTVWLPAARPDTVTLALAPIVWLVPPPTRKGYPLGASGPDVAVLTVGLPVSAWQGMVKLAWALPPGR